MVVDGAIVLDPETYAYIGYSRTCNGFEVPEPGVDFYDAKPVPHGDLRIKTYFSKIANNWRHVYIYTPPGYDDSLTTRYPVLYLQHGSGEDERVWTLMGHANYILDNLIADGKAKPMILVMETSYNIGSPGGGGGGRRWRVRGRRWRPWPRRRRQQLRSLHDRGPHPHGRFLLPHPHRPRPPRHGGPVHGGRHHRFGHHDQFG